MLDILQRKHAILVTEFDRYVVEHPEFAAKIPRNAQIDLQVEGDEEYNEWSRQLAQRQRESGQVIVYVKVKGLKPAKSRLLKPEVAIAQIYPWILSIIERDFLNDHLSKWTSDVCDDIIKRAETDFYKGIATMTKTFIFQDLETLIQEV